MGDRGDRRREESGTRRVVDAVAEQAITELRSGSFLMDPDLLEAIAAHLHERADSGDIKALCAAAGCSLIVDTRLPEGREGLLLPGGIILARPRADAARLRVTILHELAHHTLRRHQHTHADVWLLALTIGAPRPVVARCGDVLSLAAASGLPWWAAAARFDACG